MSYANYDQGSLEQVGPGLFPLLVGSALAVFGLLSAGAEMLETEEDTAISWWPLVVVSGSILLFAATINRIGIAPAVVLLILVATTVSRQLSWTFRITLAIGLAVLAVALFKLLFGMPLPIWTWRF